MRGCSVTLRSRLAVVAAVLLAVLAVAGSLLVHEVDSSQLQLADQQLASVAQAMGRLGVGTDGRWSRPRSGRLRTTLSGTYVATLSGGAASRRHRVPAPAMGPPKLPRWWCPHARRGGTPAPWGRCQVRAAGAPCW